MTIPADKNLLVAFSHGQKEERGPDDMGHQDSLDRAANALGMD